MDSPLPRPQQEDNDLRKGATEDEPIGGRTQNSMSGQLPHRGQDTLIKENDTDFPEPGNNPEHSGQHPAIAEPSQLDAELQDWRSEEPLAS